MKIGIDLGGSHISIGLIDKNFVIKEKRSFYMNDRNEMSIKNFILSSIKEGIEDILNASKIDIKDIEMIGIATPGNVKNGVITNVVNLGIEDFNIKESLEIYYQVPVKVENDGKCAGIAEKKFGSLRNYDDAIFLCIGTGIGGAVFMNGALLRPKRGSGFELGHMCIEKDGMPCKCGNRGCFEVYGSKKKFKEEVLKILGITDFGISGTDLIEEIRKNIDTNQELKELVDEYVDYLALGISNLVNIFEPEVIAIGGSLSHYEDFLFERIKMTAIDNNYLFNNEMPEIISASMGNDAGMIGAILL